MRFEDKVAAITGAGQGLGAGFAKAFAKEGAVAVLIGRTGGKLQAVAEEIRKEGGRALVKVCDIAVPEQVEQCFREIEQEAGSVDVLVNNAALRTVRICFHRRPNHFTALLLRNGAMAQDRPLFQLHGVVPADLSQVIGQGNEHTGICFHPLLKHS